MYAYNYITDTSMADRFGGLTPFGYQRIIMTVSERELTRLNFDIPTLMKKFGVSWVLLSLSVKVEKPIIVGKPLTVKTRHTWRKSILYRRDFAIYDESGERVVVAATFSALFDVEKRRITFDQKVYEEVTLPDSEEFFEANHKCAIKGEFETLEEVAVRPCWIDALGHVNNFRYGELTFDSMPENLQGKLNDLKRFEIYFNGELQLGEKVILKRSTENINADNNPDRESGETDKEKNVDGSFESDKITTILQVVGEHSDTKKNSFLARLFF